MAKRRRRRPSRRRRRNPIQRFFQRHWKKVIIAVVAIIGIIALIGILSNIANNNPSARVSATLGGANLGMFNTQSEAEANSLNLKAGTYILVVNGSNIDVQVTIGGIPVPDNIFAKISNDTYKLYLDQVGDGTTVVGKISVGGDGSITGKLLAGDIDTRFFSLTVENSSVAPSATPELMGVPTGIIFLGEDEDQFHVYETEQEAQNNIITLPISMVQDKIKVRAECSKNTVRFWVKPYWLDGKVINSGFHSIVLSSENNWTNVLDIRSSAGHELTLMLKAEDAWSLNNGYSFVTFRIPLN